VGRKTKNCFFLIGCVFLLCFGFYLRGCYEKLKQESKPKIVDVSAIGEPKVEFFVKTRRAKRQTLEQLASSPIAIEVDVIGRSEIEVTAEDMGKRTVQKFKVDMEAEGTSLKDKAKLLGYGALAGIVIGIIITVGIGAVVGVGIAGL